MSHPTVTDVTPFVAGERYGSATYVVSRLNVIRDLRHHGVISSNNDVTPFVACGWYGSASCVDPRVSDVTRDPSHYGVISRNNDVTPFVAGVWYGSASYVGPSMNGIIWDLWDHQSKGYSLRATEIKLRTEDF